MFIDFSIKDLIDILLVAYLLYQTYRLMKDSGSINIFIGILVFIGAHFQAASGHGALTLRHPEVGLPAERLPVVARVGHREAHWYLAAHRLWKIRGEPRRLRAGRNEA